MTTIQAWLQSNTELPRLECELLLGHVAGLSRAQILTHPEQTLTPDQFAELKSHTTLLRQGTPLAYILGRREFWGLEFVVTPAVLIPRPETELLVELALKHAPSQGRVLDLGTGSGAIAIAIATERPDLRVTAVDKSCAALEVAKENARQNGTKLTFAHSDWFANLNGHWHVIVSNPPYIAPNDPHLGALHAEPLDALVAAESGLADLKHIITASPDYLCERGILILEHGYNQAPDVRGLMTARGFAQVESAVDLAHIERATFGQFSVDP